MVSFRLAVFLIFQVMSFRQCTIVCAPFHGDAGLGLNPLGTTELCSQTLLPGVYQGPCVLEISNALRCSWVAWRWRREFFGCPPVSVWQFDARWSWWVVLAKVTEELLGDSFRCRKQETRLCNLSINGLKFERLSAQTEIAEYNCFGSYQPFWQTCSI